MVGLGESKDEELFALPINIAKNANRLPTLLEQLQQKLISQGYKRVVEARLADAKFFWDKDRSKNLIKQIANLK